MTAVLYFSGAFGSSGAPSVFGSSGESQLVGEWEVDPEGDKDAVSLGKWTFKKDGTYRTEPDLGAGRWQVVGKQGDALRVKLTLGAGAGGPQADSQTFTVRFRDKDRFEMEPEQANMATTMKFRRTSTGPAAR